jgi:hypothetical protein
MSWRQISNQTRMPHNSIVSNQSIISPSNAESLDGINASQNMLLDLNNNLTFNGGTQNITNSSGNTTSRNFTITEGGNITFADGTVQTTTAYGTASGGTTYYNTFVWSWDNSAWYFSDLTNLYNTDASYSLINNPTQFNQTTFPVINYPVNGILHISFSFNIEGTPASDVMVLQFFTNPNDTSNNLIFQKTSNISISFNTIQIVPKNTNIQLSFSVKKYNYWHTGDTTPFSTGFRDANLSYLFIPTT